MVKQVRRFSNKKSKKIAKMGVVHITTTFNNVIVNVTDKIGNTLVWSSAGSCGFKGAKKKTAFAAQSTSENASLKAYNQGMRIVEVIISGPGRGRESAIRAVRACGLKISLLKDTTPVPHNGCRPPKKRRV